MEVMKNAVIKTRTLKPLPGEITNEAINGATLPVKIESARRAIAECTDLPELLRYKSQAEGLAAAVRTMKEVGPELIRAANEMMADAWRKGGELLEQYSNVPMPMPNAKIKREKGKFVFGGKLPSPRKEISNRLGLTQREMESLVRVHKAPKVQVYEVASKSRSLSSTAVKLPSLQSVIPGRKSYGVHLKQIMGVGSTGLVTALAAVSRIDTSSFKHLTPDERKIVKSKITEIVELLDEMDLLCR